MGGLASFYSARVCVLTHSVLQMYAKAGIKKATSIKHKKDHNQNKVDNTCNNVNNSYVRATRPCLIFSSGHCLS